MTPNQPAQRPSLLTRVRNYFFAGLLVLAPTAFTFVIFIRILNWMDNLLGRYMRFAAFDYHRIYGLGLAATLVALVLVGFVASLIGSGPLTRLWDHMLMRIPGVGLVYGSTKSLGEAFLTQREEQAFRKVVLVQWPHLGMWRVGFLTGRASADVRAKLGEDVEVVFVPHSPNPASGFVHYAQRQDLIMLDWSVEDGLKVVISGGVVQPGSGPAAARSEAAKS